MSLIIRKPGILSTVQDLGRFGMRRFGINPGGAMDPAAVRLINSLLGNDENAAVLEMHFPAAEIEFDAATSFAIGGANFAAELDGRPVSNWFVHEAGAGSTLRFTSKVKGNRTYLAVAGGIAVEQWLGSSSTNLTAMMGGHEGRAIRAGDKLLTKGDRVLELSAGVSRTLIPIYSSFPTVRIVKGAEYDRLTAKSELDLTHEGFSVTAESNRMGFRLSGETLHLLGKKEMVSSAVSFGTIQLLPDGQLIVLMADHQTTGGYPRLGHVLSVDLPLVGQLGPGDGVGFHIVSLEEAEMLVEEFERDLKLLKLGRRVAEK
ncbi:MAG: biotin-dependent carboxyltransferase family protein [Pyrinomonadaceae bacterium]|nr:biotin-dependent carboxyltransferase family protein [Pyrinomonadaceae bacterium]